MAKRWFVPPTIPVIQSGVPAVEVVAASDYDALAATCIEHAKRADMAEDRIAALERDLAASRKEAAEARELLRDARAELGHEVDVTGPAIDAHLAKYSCPTCDNDAMDSVAETGGKHP